MHSKLTIVDLSFSNIMWGFLLSPPILQLLLSNCFHHCTPCLDQMTAVRLLWADKHTGYCEKLDSSLQQCWQHRSVRALFYAEPQLGQALPLPLAERFCPFLAIFSLFPVFQSISGYSKLFRYIPGYYMLYQAIPGYFNLSQSIWANSIFLFHWPWLCVSEAVCLKGCFSL